MRTIHKYYLPVQDEVLIEVPSLCRYLHVGEQAGKLYVWALVETTAVKQLRRILIYGTGHRIGGMDWLNSGYIGTAVMRDGMVWHVFDGRPPE